MYKLLLVEDEADVRESVLQEIDWAACGFEVVGDAENGREALELIGAAPPDVVMTDIKMPFMDGLQLSAILKERWPAIKIIILTGFDEFDYAQKAIKLHIDEYVLKPFSAQELMEALTKVKAKLDGELEQLKNVHLLEEHYRKSLPVLREVFLGSLVSQRLSRAEIEDKAHSYGVELKGSAYVAAVISPDNPEKAGAEEGGSPASSLRHSRDMDLKRFAVLNITGEIAGGAGQRLAFLHGGHVALLFASEAEDDGEALRSTLTVLEDIRTSVDKYLKFTVTIGVGTVARDIADVSYSYKDALLALDYRLLLGSNRIICIDDVERRSRRKLHFDELQEQGLIRCIKVGTEAELKEAVEALFAGVADPGVSFNDYQIYVLELATAVLKAAKDADVELGEAFGEDVNPFTALHRFTDPEEAKAWIAGMCLALAGHIATGRQSSYRSLAEQAKDYAKANYADAELSINRVCGHLHISPGYFSSIFKKETKLTFVNYLLHLRMEAAKELLRTTDLKAFEIAERVGYADPNYFSFSFRKAVGVSPKEYRSGAAGTEAGT